MVTVCLVALSGIATACDECGDKECKTPGYWKNHPEAWPDCITVGGVTYSKECAIAAMKEPVKGDKTYNMFDALVAAKLNVANGCYKSCETTDTIRGADRWMKIYKLGSGVKASSDAWQEEFIFFTLTYPSGEAMYQKLDAFNNGY
ncbi:hypothetical protein [Methanosarcina sp.]|uniref:hypothetical protein n=1 Tax=Methanosarcina sp. TaxID=2213 RepID=UPI003C717151